ncbi:MAG: hypothetical protein CBC47_02635 [Alphaproteobacteria bacterium TMED87]|nr:hypothetical protein [Rhodospirillaceae bacterium]OUV10767.1 MAG: hypothetical protein CBC47_02635 [Alphaproteobacteria bacterium TMED87]
MTLTPKAKQKLINILEIFQKGQVQLALEEINKLYDLFPNSDILNNNYGVILSKINKEEDAINFFNKAININDKYVSAYNNLGNLLSKRGKTEDAIFLFKKAVQIDKTNEDILYSIAINLSLMQKYHESIIYFNKIISLNQNNPEVYNDLGTVYFSMGKNQEALENFLKSVDLNSTYAEAQCNTGLALNILNRNHEAIPYFKTAILLSPKFPDALHGLASCYNSIGNKDMALLYFKKVLQLLPDHTIAKHMVNSLSGNIPKESPEDYVTLLFDKYSDNFDNDLVNNLKYSIPSKLRLLVDSINKESNTFKKAVDLGCGTGLCGESFKNIVTEIIGIDLSSKMLLKASEKSIYDFLIHDGIVNGLRSIKENQDLFISADVFIYIGKLDDLFFEVISKSNKDSIFVFSIELTDRDNFILQDSGRYAHSHNYIIYLANRYHFTIESNSNVGIRKEKGEWIPGSIYALRYIG